MKKPRIKDFEIGNTGPGESPYDYFKYVKALEEYINDLENILISLKIIGY